MIQSNVNKANDREAQVQKALADIQSSKYKGTKSTTCAYNLSDNTFHYHMAGCNSHINAQQLQQIFSETEENIFLWWITRFTYVGFLALPSLVVQMVEEIHCKHIYLRNNTNASNQFAQSIGHNWLYQFKFKHFEFVGI